LKKLRYSAKVTRYVKRIKKVLNLLGEMNDLVSAGELLDSLDRRATARRGTEALRARWARRHEALRRKLPKTLRKLKAAKPFWA